MCECLLCRRDMKKSANLFGTGCLKSVYKFLDMSMPRKNKEIYLQNNIMERLNIDSLNENQKMWLTDRYLTKKYLENIRYGDFSKLKLEVDSDLESISKLKQANQIETSNKISLKDAYAMWKKSIKFEENINELKKSKKMK